MNFREKTEEYFIHLKQKLDSIQVSKEDGTEVSFVEGMEFVGDLVMEQSRKGKKLMFIGNGASAAIASHMSTDYWKNGGMRAVAFNDSSLLTCVGNDYGYKHVFEKPIEMFADSGDVLFAISSSGKSKNILLGVNAARSRNCHVITLSGFEKDNPLRPLGDFNFYVSSPDYGPVEIIHLSVCHGLLDAIIESRNSVV